MVKNEVVIAGTAVKSQLFSIDNPMHLAHSYREWPKDNYYQLIINVNGEEYSVLLVGEPANHAHAAGSFKKFAYKITSTPEIRLTLIGELRKFKNNNGEVHTAIVSDFINPLDNDNQDYCSIALTGIIKSLCKEDKKSYASVAIEIMDFNLSEEPSYYDSAYYNTIYGCHEARLININENCNRQLQMLQQKQTNRVNTPINLYISGTLPGSKPNSVHQQTAKNIEINLTECGDLAEFHGDGSPINNKSSKVLPKNIVQSKIDELFDTQEELCDAMAEMYAKDPYQTEYSYDIENPCDIESLYDIENLCDHNDSSRIEYKIVCHGGNVKITTQYI